MEEGRIVLVHGTGVRMDDYKSSFNLASGVAKDSGIALPFVECLWGDAEGVGFAGRSLPDPPTPEVQARMAKDEADWARVLQDPLCELAFLAAYPGGGTNDDLAPGERTLGEMHWEKIHSYVPSQDFRALLKRVRVEDLMWMENWSFVMLQPESMLAFRSSEEDIQDAGQTLARALVSRLNQLLIEAGMPGLNRDLRDRMVARLVMDWGLQTLGIGGWLRDLGREAVMRLVRRKRTDISLSHAAKVGDILLYQSQGALIRNFIRKKVESSPAPVTLIGHSLGGIACLDLLAEKALPNVKRLVTLGSQAPLLYELDALSNIRLHDELPANFPPWLNVYDRNDILSFVAERLFGGADRSVTDHEAISGLWPIAAHSAYFGDPQVWTQIATFIKGT